MSMFGYCEDGCSGPENTIIMFSDRKARKTPNKTSLCSDGMSVALMLQLN